MNHLPIPRDIGDYLRYNEQTGVVSVIKRWSVRGGRYKSGSAWGYPNRKGYLRAKFRGKDYYVHRVIWYLKTGIDPELSTPDHIDGIRDNNCWDNLRLLSSQSEQLMNTGSLGYYWSKQIKRFVSRINADGRTTHISSTSCPLLARISYHDVATSNFPHISIPFVPRRPILGRPSGGQLFTDVSKYQ